MARLDFCTQCNTNTPHDCSNNCLLCIQNAEAEEKNRWDNIPLTEQLKDLDTRLRVVEKLLRRGNPTF